MMPALGWHHQQLLWNIQEYSGSPRKCHDRIGNL